MNQFLKSHTAKANYLIEVDKDVRDALSREEMSSSTSNLRKSMINILIK